MHRQVLNLEVPADRSLYLWFEPWAEGVAIRAGSNVELQAMSEVVGELELDVGPESTAVYGWAGCTLRVIVDGQPVTSFDIPVPVALTRDKVTMLFGSPPTPTQDELALTRKRPWWRMWN
jgi:hypothetical protein